MDKRRLASFRKRLEQQRDELSVLLAKTDSASRGMGGKGRGDEGEQAALSYDRDLLHSQRHSGQSVLRLVADALDRLADGGYGICEECGRPISLKRLDAVPWTPHCRDCQEQVESEAGAA